MGDYADYFLEDADYMEDADWDISTNKKEFNYSNTKKTWNHRKIKDMSLSHIFNTANLIAKKARVLFLLDRDKAEENGLTVEDNPVSYKRWFKKKFPCYPTLLSYLSQELKDNVGKI